MVCDMYHGAGDKSFVAQTSELNRGSAEAHICHPQSIEREHRVFRSLPVHNFWGGGLMKS